MLVSIKMWAAGIGTILTFLGIIIGGMKINVPTDVGGFWAHIHSHPMRDGIPRIAITWFHSLVVKFGVSVAVIWVVAWFGAHYYFTFFCSVLTDPQNYKFGDYNPNDGHCSVLRNRVNWQLLREALPHSDYYIATSKLFFSAASLILLAGAGLAVWLGLKYFDRRYDRDVHAKVASEAAISILRVTVFLGALFALCLAAPVVYRIGIGYYPFYQDFITIHYIPFVRSYNQAQSFHWPLETHGALFLVHSIAWMPPIALLGVVLFIISRLSGDDPKVNPMLRVSRSAWKLLPAFIGGLFVSFLLTAAANTLGATPVRLTLQLLMSNAICDALTIAGTAGSLGALLRNYNGKSILLTLAFNLVLAATLAYGAIFLGLLGTPDALTFSELTSIFTAGWSVGRFPTLDSLFWIMHTTFIPLLAFWAFLLLIILAKIVGRVVDIVIAIFSGRWMTVTAEPNGGLAKTGLMLCTLSGILEFSIWLTGAS